MAGPLSVFDIAGRAMSAQLVRLNTTASNLANAGSIASSRDAAYRALKPVFTSTEESPGVSSVSVSQVVNANTEPTKRHDPDNPMADKNGDVWEAGVDSAAEMIEMIETARQYQNNVQVMQTAKSLTLDTLRLDR